MADVDILLYGIPGYTSQGYLGQSSVVLVDGETLIDVGSMARRDLLLSGFDNAGVETEDVESVLFTHLHYDHVENLDLFPDATVYVYGPELDRVEAGDLDGGTHPHTPEILADHEVVRLDDGDRVEGFEVMHTPGHIEHHVSFLMEADGMTYGFTGDGVKNIHEFETRNPMVLWDADVAVETLDRIARTVDFVVPGHDAPFYVEDGNAVPTADIEFGLRLQLSADSAVEADLSSARAEVRELPPGVNDATASLGLAP